MTSPAVKLAEFPPDLSEGPLAQELREKAEFIAFMADADLGPKPIRWFQGGERTGYFEVEKSLTVRVDSSGRTLKGYVSYGTLGRSSSTSAARQEAEAIAAALVASDSIKTIVRTQLLEADLFKSLCASEEGEIAFPAERVVSFSQYSCDPCAGSGTLICGGCKGKGSVWCSSCSGGTIYCGTCAGSGRCFDAGNRTYYNCPVCIGRGRLTCNHCHGTQWLTCRGCGGGGEIRCKSCGGHGGFTEEFSVGGITRFETTYKSVPLEDLQGPAFKAWVSNAFPGASDERSKALPKPYYKSDVKRVSAISGQTTSCVVDLHGEVMSAVVEGRFDDCEVLGTALVLDKISFRFAPYLDKILTEKANEALRDDPNLKTIAERVQNVGLLDFVRKEFATSKKFDEALLGRAVELAHGGVKAETLKPFATTYSQVKKTFARSLWMRSWKTFALRSIPLAALFIFLNVPYRLHSIFDEEFTLGETDVAASILFGVLAGIPTLLAMLSIRKGIMAELGKKAQMPAGYNSLYFIAAWAAISVATLFGSFSPMLQGPDRSGQYLSKAVFWADAAQTPLP
ncbi:hypothetical protein [Microvirga sp. TS319]|uniref:DnaJ-like cysteine-rich domain-containing protein n=1 Tax=Microvirga sp. TS319 TaxID=3241165 RepID=UPI00351A0F56